MSRGVNKAIIVGTLGDDPTMRYMPSGKAVAKISVATNESWKDKTTGEQKESTEWHRVVMFDRLGEIAGEYLKKGSQVYIEGKIQTKSYEKDGVKKYSTEIVAREMQMLGGKGEKREAGPRKPEAAPPAPDDFDDDIPF